MERDPIVEEVRAIRDAFAREHGYDLESIVTALQEERAKSGRQAVSLPPATAEDQGRAQGRLRRRREGGRQEDELMASLLIRDFPPELHLKLKQSAEKNRRSMTKEVIALLEMALEGGPPARRELSPPIDLGFPLTDEFLDRAKREGRE